MSPTRTHLEHDPRRVTRDGEPVLMIEAASPWGVQAAREFARQLRLLGAPEALVDACYAHAVKMREWQDARNGHERSTR